MAPTPSKSRAKRPRRARGSRSLVEKGASIGARGEGFPSRKPRDYRSCATFPSSIHRKTPPSPIKKPGAFPHAPLDGKGKLRFLNPMFRSPCKYKAGKGRGLKRSLSSSFSLLPGGGWRRGWRPKLRTRPQLVKDLHPLPEINGAIGKTPPPTFSPPSLYLGPIRGGVFFRRGSRREEKDC
ncbi:hypothetical protein GWK47_034764 [Chionoecetes opilio]|uniref:Uncharacterized protein n=1 Tax=Chionoecetes opilio TaxID=41210 RepID=A0A8J5CNY7_CHIOP|nr:hypothetical protein GWK47_034764 [Chionoecetes opilio]